MGGDGGRAPAGPLPPGFRFRPTDEELLTHYLAPKAADAGFAPAAVREVDLYRAEPWDLLPGAGGGEDGDGDAAGRYFFCRRSVKFPSGLRTNRATRAGYWKSTGKDKVVRRQHGGDGGGDPLGVKKTLVFYRGRAPAGHKTSWVMHEYRLVQGHGYTSPVLATGAQSEWVICRMFMKKAQGETSQLEQEISLRPPLDDHLHPSVDGCDRDGWGKAPAPAAAAASDDSNSDHGNCFSCCSAALAMAQGGNDIEGLLQLNHEELLMNFSSGLDYASASSASTEATLLLRDELAADSFDFLPQLLDYEAFPFILQDF